MVIPPMQWVGWRSTDGLAASPLIRFDVGVGRLVPPVVREQRHKPGPAARAPALHRAGSAVEDRGGLLDAVPLHVDEHQGGSLIVAQLPQRGEHVGAALA